MLLLYNAPDFPLAKANREQVNTWMLPLFPQSWNLFAPSPPTANGHLVVRTHHGTQVGEWIDLTAHDIAAYRGNPLPSREDQIMLRKVFSLHQKSSPETQLKAPRTRSGQLLRNLVLARLDDLGVDPGDRIELRVISTPVPRVGVETTPAPSHTKLGTWEVRP